jgi:SPP1 family predicted phage head-tail adaptor
MLSNKRHLLTLETRTETPDSFGEAALSYTELATAWGSIESVNARERFEAQQVKADVSHRITLRYAASYAGLSPSDRITYGSRTFDLVSVMDRDGMSREIEILALERL